MRRAVKGVSESFRRSAVALACQRRRPAPHAEGSLAAALAELWTLALRRRVGGRGGVAIHRRDAPWLWSGRLDEPSRSPGGDVV